MDVAAALLRARHTTGLTQQRLARRAGVSPSALSRYESGTALPSLPTLDRLLAACGKDVRLVVVDRVDDLEVEFARRAAMTLQGRARAAEFLRPSFLERLATVGSGILVAGSWAAELHGIPAERAPGRLLVADDPEVFAALAAAFMRGSVPWRATDGHLGSMPVRPSTFVEHPQARWWQSDVGHFLSDVVPGDGAWPRNQRVDTPSGPLRVLAPQELTDSDGVPAELLSAWTAWRNGVGPDNARWAQAPSSVAT